MAMLLCFTFQANAQEIITELGLQNALSNSGEYQLGNDLTTTTAITTSGVTSVIDLSGHTLTIGAGDNKFCDASNITIKNGTISITGLTVGGNAVFCLDEYEKTLATTLTLENVNLVGDGYSSAYCIFYIGSSSVLNVKGGVWSLENDKSTSGGVFKAEDSAATLNIDGLDLTAHNVRRVVLYAATTIKNSTLAISGDADGVDAEMEHGFNRSPLAISNSTITMTDMVGRGITAENGAVTIESSTVTMTNCQEATIDVRGGQTVTIDDASTVELDKEPTITSGTISGDVVLPVYVAKIGDVEYTSLQAAVDAATTGQTIILLADVELTETLIIPADKTVVLNLNSKTISQTKECTASYEMIRNKGNLTIKGEGKISFKDTSAGDPTYSWGSYTLRNEGTLVVENSTIEHLGEQNSGSVNHMYCAIFQYCGSTTINGGTISTPTYRSVRLWKGDMTINGGTFDGQVWVQAVDNSSNLEINGGTFSPAGVDGSSVFVGNSGYTVEFAVTDGTFNTKIGCSDAASLAGAITGGSFTAAAKENTNSALIADGCTFGEPDENGLYGIVSAPVAKIGDAEYTSFKDALAAAQDGDTIKLIANVVCAEKPVYGGSIVCVDVNGYTFESNDYNRVRNVISADGAIASNNIKFVSGFGWEVYNAAGSTSYEGTNFHVFPSLEEAVAYNPGGRSLAARIYAYEDVKQTADVTLRATTQGTSSTICIDPAYEITWDLNGYTLLQESPTGNPLEACVRGKLVLDDTSDAKTGKWIAGACGVTDTSSSWYGNGGPALYVLGDGEVVLKGGTVSISRNSNVNSVGGEVVNSGGLIRLDGGKLTMAGGTLQMDDTYGIMAWGGSVVVESGNFVCGENNSYSIFAMKYYTDASVEVNAPVAGTLLLHSTVSAIVNASNVTYYADGTDYVAPVLAEGLAALPDLNGNYVVGEEPTATVNNLGATTIAGGEYSIYDGSFKGTTAADPAMPLSFVMQFLADQDEDDMATSPYADWYGDFVLTFTGLENGSFSAEGCYLAGYYGSFGWVKVPVEGLLTTIEEGVRYPVMLGVGLGQKYDYICTGVKDFRCALYIPETVLKANPNIEVKLELSVVDNSKGQDAAAEALVNGENIYEVGAYEYEAKDFNPGYLREYTINDADALDYTQAEDKIIGTLTYNRNLIEGIWNPLYLPFSVSLKDLADNYEVAYYNTMHSYDNDNDGTFETFEMEVLKLTANELNDVMLRANYPYFIRPKNADACALRIVETDATLFAAAEKVITTTSVSHTFQLKSTHKALDAAALTGCYAISVDGDWALTAGLKPHRLYLTISANDDSPYATTAAKTIRIVARGDEGFEGTTGVDIVETDNAADGTIYDLSGRPVEEPVKGGMYIINGKKVVY